MADFFKYQYSSSHMFFPKIVMAILAVLGLCIVIPWLVKKIRRKEPLFPKDKRFFAENYDKVKLFGTLILLVLYILALEWIGFVPAGLIFVFLFNVLYCGTLQWKSLLTAAIITVVFVLGVWLVFGKLFNITLP